MPRASSSPPLFTCGEGEQFSLRAWLGEGSRRGTESEQKLFINGIYFDKSFPRDVQISKLAANKDL